MYKLIVRTEDGEFVEDYTNMDDMKNSANEWFIEAMHFDYSVLISMYENSHLLKLATLTARY